MVLFRLIRNLKSSLIEWSEYNGFGGNAIKETKP